MASSDLQVSVIILNWNGRPFLEPCLSSLFAQTFTDFEIVLVDNGSTDDSIQFLQTHFVQWQTPESRPHLKLVQLTQNTGFAGGNLIGLENCNPHTRYIATLNNDTQAAPDWLERLVSALDQKELSEPSHLAQKWGAACGPMLFASVKPSDPPVIAAAGIEVFRNGLAMDGQIGLVYDPHNTPQTEVFGPCAGAALYNRAALEEVRFFDEAFFAYLEDADLAWRLRLQGWRTLYVNEAKVWHEYSGTGGQNSPFKNYQLGRNRIWTIYKNFPGSILLRCLPAIIFYDLAATIYTLAKGNTRSLAGRLAALRPTQLRRIHQQRRQVQSHRQVELREIESWLQPDPPLLKNLRLRQRVNKLAFTKKTGNFTKPPPAGKI